MDKQLSKLLASRSYHTSDFRRWVTGLNFFRLYLAPRAWHTDDDFFQAAVRFGGEEDLHEVLGALGVKLQTIPPNANTTFPGQTGFRCPIDEFPQLEQPGYQEINGVRVMVFVRSRAVDLFIGEIERHVLNPSEVTEDDFRRAQRVEQVLESLTARIIDPPDDSWYCVAPKFYPELWKDDLPVSPIFGVLKDALAFLIPETRILPHSTKAGGLFGFFKRHALNRSKRCD